MKKHLTWIPAIYIAFVFIQSLFFKFTGSEETVIIFSTIGTWMGSIGFPDRLAGYFAQYGGIGVGSVELIASMLVLWPRTRFYGAAVALLVISGAIFFHLFTPLGVNRIVDAAGNTDGGVLFMMACGVWLCAAFLIGSEFGKKQDTTFVH
ncbi:MAG: hypothetical protein R3227_17020 [Reinekea sp.]|nr:hypothetical protein [Reinekea sp.]